MSLIQEALKRKTEEQRHLPPQAPPAPTPPPEPPPLPKPAPASTQKKHVPLSTLILLLLMTAMGGYLLMSRLPKPAAAQKTEPAPVETEPHPTVQPEPEPEPEKEVPAAKPAVNWPELTYSGAAAGGSHVLAIINGRMLSIGDSIQGVTVLKIGKTDVMVEYQGEKRILRAGGQ